LLDSNTVKDSLTEENILTMLQELGLQPIESDSKMECLTMCHGGDSHKLIYYKDTHMFMCYTHCGSMDIFTLLSKVRACSFHEALVFVANRFNIQSIITTGFDGVPNMRPVRIPDFKPKTVELSPLQKLDDSIMNTFYDMYYDGWLKEGISTRAMDKFEIKYYLLDNQITIPHRNINGDLVGIRVRNLNPEEIEAGRKYIPIFLHGKSLRYLNGMNLYGFYQNKEAINRTRKVIIFEAEKSVLKMEDYFPNNNYSVAISGSNMTAYQEKILDDNTDIDEVIVALDKEFQDVDSDEARIYAQKINKIYGKMCNRYNVSVLWDSEGLLNKKDSPVDQGKEVFERLYRNRLFI